MMKLSKFNYIQNEINNNPRNDKIFWNIVKTLTGDKRSTNPIPHDLSTEDLNLHFSSVGSTLAQTFSTDLPEWNAPECIYSLSLQNVEISFTLKQLKSLPDRPKLDVLNIDSKLMKLSADYIAPSLTQIINLTLTQNY